jgi:3-keto-L-gulonate-6-phosphate decarboxylase
LIQDGAEILVIGAAIFAAAEPRQAISRLKEIIARGKPS